MPKRKLFSWMKNSPYKIRTKKMFLLQTSPFHYDNIISGNSFLESSWSQTTTLVKMRLYLLTITLYNSIDST